MDKEEVRLKEPEVPVIKERLEGLYRDEFLERRFTFYHFRQLLAQALACFWGMFIVVFFGCKSAWNTALGYIDPEPFPITLQQQIFMATALIAIYHINGSLLNMGFNISKIIMGRMSVGRWLLFTTFEFLGALFAVSLIKELLWDVELLEVNVFNEITKTLHPGQVVLFEFLGSFAINLGICGFLDERRSHTEAPLVIFFPIVFALFGFLHLGMELNPIRHLAFVCAGCETTFTGAHIAMPLVGALAGSLVYATLLDAHLDKSIVE